MILIMIHCFHPCTYTWRMWRPCPSLLSLSWPGFRAGRHSRLRIQPAGKGIGMSHKLDVIGSLTISINSLMSIFAVLLFLNLSTGNNFKPTQTFRQRSFETKTTACHDCWTLNNSVSQTRGQFIFFIFRLSCYAQVKSLSTLPKQTNRS